MSKYGQIDILGHLFRIFVTQAYPKGYEKAITNITKEWRTNKAEAT